MAKTVLVMYGGVSPEHEVSIVTALQVMHALKEAGHSVKPLYISKAGDWVLGTNQYLKPEFYRDLNQVVRTGKVVVLPPDRNLKLLTKGFLGFGAAEGEIDIVFPVFHGSQGEDGTIQGLLELANLPYVGCGVTASALGMDKYLSKRVAADLGLNVTRDCLVTAANWVENKKSVLAAIKKLGNSWFIKPATLGSSIGAGRAETIKELENAIEVGLVYSSRVIVEEALSDITEVNISILGNDPYQLSQTEQPISSGSILSFADKYLRPSGKTKGMAGAARIIPAPVDKKIITEIETATRKFFSASGGTGIARLDFMVVKNKVYFNEINTLPGSLAFYLWEATGKKFSQLADELLVLAEENFAAKQKLTTTFKSNILANFRDGGSKGKA